MFAVPETFTVPDALFSTAIFVPVICPAVMFIAPLFSIAVVDDVIVPPEIATVPAEAFVIALFPSDVIVPSVIVNVPVFAIVSLLADVDVIVPFP